MFLNERKNEKEDKEREGKKTTRNTRALRKGALGKSIILLLLLVIRKYRIMIQIYLMVFLIII